MANARVSPPPIAARLMLHALVRNWWLLLLRGLCAILFRILAFVWPGVTLFTLVLFYGAYALVAGPRWWLATVGILGVPTIASRRWSAARSRAARSPNTTAAMASNKRRAQSMDRDRLAGERALHRAPRRAILFCGCEVVGGVHG